jgi:hypothetical protein
MKPGKKGSISKNCQGKKITIKIIRIKVVEKKLKRDEIVKKINFLKIISNKININ